MGKIKAFRKSKYFYVVILAVVLLAVLLIGGVSAKYIHSNNGRNVVAAKEFYFTSNLLKEEGAEYVLNATADSISFTLGNNFDQLRMSAENIYYTVSVECADTEDETQMPTISADEGTLAAGEKPAINTVTISNLKPGVEYEVTAVGKTGDSNKLQEGYKQTLRATFTVSAGDENVYQHLDVSNDAYVLLTVWTENVAGTATITVNGTDALSEVSGLVPDSTDPILNAVHNYDADTKKYEPLSGDNMVKDTTSFAEEYSSRTYRFFLDEEKSYSVENFNVIITDSDRREHVASVDTP